MSNFPLYEDLKKDNPKKDLTAKKKLEFIDNMKKMDKDGMELVYGLIRSHMNVSNDPELCNLFQNISNDEIVLDFNELPILLKHILYKFVNKNIKVMEENSSLDLSSEITDISDII